MELAYIVFDFCSVFSFSCHFLTTGIKLLCIHGEAWWTFPVGPWRTNLHVFTQNCY